jgi:hypothetical protein
MEGVKVNVGGGVLEGVSVKSGVFVSVLVERAEGTFDILGRLQADSIRSPANMSRGKGLILHIFPSFLA